MATGRRPGGAEPLLGRDAEIAMIDRTVRGTGPGRRSLVVVGEAGAGKTQLLHLARSYAPAGRSVLVQGSELEADLGYAGLTQLVRQLRPALGGLARTQRAVLAHVTSTGRPAVGDRFAVGVALLELLTRAARSGPLLVLVDDLQWLDAATVEALAFAARRLDRHPVPLVLASRRPAPRAVADLPPLPLAGLDTGATGALLVRSSGCRVAPDVVQAVQRDTGGIPLAVVELGRTLRPEQLAGAEPLDHPLPVGERLEQAYARRIAALPPVVRRALVLLAAAGGTDPAGDLARLGVPLADLAPAEAAGLVTLAGGQAAFRHPVIRSACYHGANGPDRRRAHGLLARANPAADVSAWHLAHATVGVDDRAAAGLARVARRARLRHAHAEASRALRRAAELTSDRDRAAEFLVAAAAEQRLAGRLDQAGRLLDRAARLSPDPTRACQVAQERARIALFRGHPMSTHALLVDAAGQVARTDPDRAADLLLDAVFPAILAGESTRGLAAARRAAAICGESDPRVALALGVSAAEALSEAESLRQLRRAAASLSGGGAAAMPHAGLAALGLALHGALPEALGLISESVATLRAQGMIGLLPFPLAVSSILAFWAGRWPESQVSGAEASRLAEATGHGTDVAAVFGAFVAAGMGREPDCRAAAALARETIARTGNAGLRCWLSAALGKLELGLSRFERAVEEFDQVFADQTPGAVPEWQADRVEALWRAGRCTEAVEAADRLWAWAARNRQPLGVAFAARSRLLVAGDHDLDRWGPAALSAFGSLRRPFERARLALVMGERQRRARRLTEARAHLRVALAGFERLGTAPWASRAEAELRAAGGGAPGADRDRAGAADALTPQELQVALAVAGGATNREVAGRLLVSPKTVAYHLNRAYRKLGVRNRVELARAISDRPGSAAVTGPAGPSVPGEPASARRALPGPLAPSGTTPASAAG